MNGAGSRGKHRGTARWLLRNTDDDEVIGIITFDYKTIDYDTALNEIDKILGMNFTVWDWKTVTKAEYGTYRAFGFKEYTIGEKT